MDGLLRPFMQIWNFFIHGGLVGHIMLGAIVVCVSMLLYMWISGRRS